MDAVVLESVFTDIESAVSNRVKTWLGPPGKWYSTQLTAWFTSKMGIDPSQLRPIDGISRVQCPLLVISGSKDKNTLVSDTKRLFESASSPNDLSLYMPVFHIQAMWLAVVGLVILRCGVRVDESSRVESQIAGMHC